MKMKGIFYNSQKAMCSIYSSGLMCYNVLKNSTKYQLDYTEEHVIKHNYDFMVMNFHHNVCTWVRNLSIGSFIGKKFCIVTEVNLVDENDIAPYTDKIFDHYIILDPTIKETSTIHAFPRPLLECKIPKYNPNSIPIIGSFGLPTDGKQWDKIFELVANEFDEAVIRINIPDPAHIHQQVKNIVKGEIEKGKKFIQNKKGIKYEITEIYFETQEKVIAWCSQNTINVFLYDRHHTCGLAAVTDQAIIAERPLLVSSHKTFRHIHSYMKHYPEISIKEAIETTLDGVLQIKNDWSSINFIQKFELLL